MDEGSFDQQAAESRTQEVTKDNVNHRYMPKGSDPDKTYNTTEEHLSPWQEEWRRIGMEMEQLGFVGTNECLSKLDSLTVNATILVQALKR